MRQLRLILLLLKSSRPHSALNVADGFPLPGIMASSECDWERVEGAIKGAQSEEMGSAVSDLSGMPEQERSAVTHPVWGGAVKHAFVPPVPRSTRVTAESHSNPFHLPNSTCIVAHVSIDMVPQVLTSLMLLFFFF